MSSARAAASAAPGPRDAIASTSAFAARRMPGMTLATPMLAVETMPQRTVLIRSLPAGLTRASPSTSLAQISTKGSQTLLVDGSDIGQRSETVRRANLSAIVRGLHERGPLSRSDLVAATGLTRSAIRSLVGELVTAGFVNEVGAVRLGTPGRPSPLVRLNATGAAVLSLEILVDSIAAAIVGLGGETIEKVRIQRPRGELSVDEVDADLSALANELLARVDAPVM